MKRWMSTLLIILCCWAFLSVVFGIYDLAISRALYDPFHRAAIFADEYGHIPGYAIIVSAFFLFFVSFFVRSNREMRTRMRKFSVFVVLLAIVSPLLFVNTFKFFVKRTRFRCLSPSFSRYTPWYMSPVEPSFVNCFASFPSGHTAMAFMLIPLAMLFGSKAAKWTVLIASFWWGLFVAYGRIVIGCHYASDVLFSACFSLVISVLLYAIIYRVGECPCEGEDGCWCRL